MPNIITRQDAEALIPVESSKEIITAVSESSAALKLMKRLRNMTSKERKLPVLSALPVAGFVEGDIGLIPVSDAAWKNKFVVAEEIAVIIPISENVLDDAEYDIWAEIKPSIIEAFGMVIDGAIFFNVDKPESWPEGIVPTAISKNKSVAIGSNDDLVEDINMAMSLVEVDGYEVNAFTGDTTMKAKLRGLRDQNGGLLFQPSLTAGTPSTLYAQPIDYVKNGSWKRDSALLLAGDFSQAVYSIRKDMSYKVLDQAVINDNQGKIIYNLAQQNMVGLKCVMRLGWQLPNPVTRLNGNDDTRYPFAVLTPEGKV